MHMGYTYESQSNVPIHLLTAKGRHAVAVLRPRLESHLQTTLLYKKLAKKVNPQPLPRATDQLLVRYNTYFQLRTKGRD